MVAHGVGVPSSMGVPITFKGFLPTGAIGDGWESQPPTRLKGVFQQTLKGWLSSNTTRASPPNSTTSGLIRRLDRLYPFSTLIPFPLTFSEREEWIVLKTLNDIFGSELIGMHGGVWLAESL